MSEKAKLTGNYFGTIYLTVISLLQGVALSQLVPSIIEFLKKTSNPLGDINTVPLMIMLLIIFIVWHHYAIGIFFLRWFPNIIDTVIPFMISIGQFYLISYFNIDKDTDLSSINVWPWATGLAAFLLLGSVGYFAAAIRNSPELFTNLMSIHNAEKHCRKAKRLYMAGGYSVLFQGMFVILILAFHEKTLLVFSLVFLAAHLILTEHFLMRNIKPHFVHSMDEFDASRQHPVMDD
jgi:hypothetical protein